MLWNSVMKTIKALSLALTFLVLTYGLYMYYNSSRRTSMVRSTPTGTLRIATGNLSTHKFAQVPNGLPHYEDVGLDCTANPRKVPILHGARCIAENKSLFFLETDAQVAGFHARKLCSFESAARANPNRPIIVLMSTKNKIPLANLTLLEGYPNLYLAQIDYDDLLQSNQQALEASRGLDKHASRYPVMFADIVRLLVLQKFGGAYMDSDTVSISEFPDVDNFAITDVDPNADINNGILQFERGNAFLEAVIDAFGYTRNFGHILSFGPFLFRHVRTRQCPNRNYNVTDDRIAYSCDHLDFSVLKRKMAHRWDTRDWAKQVSPTWLQYMLNEIKDSFAIHYFGNKIKIGNVPFSKKSALYDVMKPYCPKSAVFLERETPDS